MDEETRVFLSLGRRKQTQSKHFLESSLNHSASSHHLIETQRQFHILSFETAFSATSLDNIEKRTALVLKTPTRRSPVRHHTGG